MFRVHIHDRLREHPGAQRIYTHVSRQPPWVLITAVVAALLVFALPLLLLAFAAMAVFFVVALLHGAATALGRAFRYMVDREDSLHRDDGRVNVRVIRRD